jgi:hypothetical protein
VSRKIKFHRESFIQNFLSPVSRLTDNVPLYFTDEEVYTVCANQDGSVVLLASYNTGNDDTFKINLPDIKKFVRLLDCIEDEELILDEVVSLLTIPNLTLPELDIFFKR